MANIGAGTGTSLSVTGNISGSNVNATTNVVAGGTVKSNNIIANNIVVSNSVNIPGSVTLANLSTTGNIVSSQKITATGNIQGGNLYATWNISAINGTIYGASANITSIIATTLNVGTLTQGNLSTPGFVSAGGNISGKNVSSNGNIIVTGFVTAGGNLTGSNINGSNVRSTGTVSGATISASGNVIAGGFLNTNGTPYQSPGGPSFIATITSGQGLVTSPVSITQRTLIFNTASKNVGAGYNTTTGTFTAPTAGFYQVSAACAVTPASVGQVINYYGQAVLGIYRNGAPVAAGGFVDARGTIIGGVAIGAFSASSVSPLVYLNVGDTLQCKLAYITNAPTNFWNTYANVIPNYFQACWLRS